MVIPLIILSYWEQSSKMDRQYVPQPQTAKELHRFSIHNLTQKRSPAVRTRKTYISKLNLNSLPVILIISTMDHIDSTTNPPELQVIQDRMLRLKFKDLKFLHKSKIITRKGSTTLGDITFSQMIF